MTAPSWPPELEARAKELYESGKYSCAQVAHTVGGGKSRNAVIGLAKRRGWVNPTPAKSNWGKPKRTKTVRAPDFSFRKSTVTIEQPFPYRKPNVAEPEFLGLTLLELGKRDCRYPRGGDDGSAVLFCGQVAAEDQVYCSFHCGICYAPSPARKFVAFKTFR